MQVEDPRRIAGDAQIMHYELRGPLQAEHLKSQSEVRDAHLGMSQMLSRNTIQQDKKLRVKCNHTYECRVSERLSP